MIPSHPCDVVWQRKLHMRNAVVSCTVTVRGARRLDGIERSAHCAITDRVNVKIEAGQVHALHVLEFHSALMLKLTAGYPALPRMKPVRGHEGGNCGGRSILFLMRANVAAQ